MVDVGSKDTTRRSATASGRIYIPKSAYDLITGLGDSSGANEAFRKARSKGDVLTVAQLAAIMGCKRTPDLIPLCHPLQISNVSVTLTPERDMRQVSPPRDQSSLTYSIKCTATVACEGKTGVEMEALTAVSVGLLTVWDMLKAVAGKEMTIGEIMVTHKTGGKSGDFTRDL
jgi:molybdenum cofactor biosynthesis protein MoaC